MTKQVMTTILLSFVFVTMAAQTPGDGTSISFTTEYVGTGSFAPYMDELYMHEYGHYSQSQEYGFGYLFSVGIPSLWDLPVFGHGNEDEYIRGVSYKKHSLNLINS